MGFGSSGNAVLIQGIPVDPAAPADKQVLVYSASGNKYAPGNVSGSDFANQAKNTMFSGPGSGADAAPTFRVLVANDIPSSLNPITIAQGAITVSAPIFDLSQTWNAGGVTFTGLKLNITPTAFANGSLFLDVQNTGVSILSFDPNTARWRFSGEIKSDNYIGFYSGVTQTTKISGTSDGHLTVWNGAASRNFDLNFTGLTGNRTITVPDVSGTLAYLGAGQTFTSAVWNGTAVGEIYGGTNQTSYALGDTLYSSASNTLAKLAGNTTSTKQFLSQTGTGAVSAAPAWGALVAGDIPSLAASIITSGQLAQARGGTGKDTSGATDGQVLIGKSSDHSLNLATLTAGSNITITNGAGAITIAASSGNTTVNPTINGFRLTSVSGSPVPSRQTGIGTIYLTPFISGEIWTYDSSVWTQHLSAEVSLALTVTSGKNYDVFAYWTGSAVALELSAAWTNDTTRADALATQNGVFVKSSDHSRRHVGLIRASGTNITEDSYAKAFLVSCCNPVQRIQIGTDTTDNWTESSTTWVAMNGGNAAWKREFLVPYNIGESVTPYYVTARLTLRVAGDGTNNPYVGIALDVTNALSSDAEAAFGAASSTSSQVACNYRSNTIGIGYHYLQGIEEVTGGTTCHYYSKPATGITQQVGMFEVVYPR